MRLAARGTESHMLFVGGHLQDKGMGALEKFLAEEKLGRDPSALISKEIEAIDSQVPPRSLYKYFSNQRCEFFKNPAVRFTQRTALNDPFELTKRWREFAGNRVGDFLAQELRGSLSRLTANKGLILQILKERLAKEGLFLAPDEMAEASRLLLSHAGNHFYRSKVTEALVQADLLTKGALIALNSAAKRSLDRLVSELGIFSLSEQPDNDQLWGLYASSGSGFVVEFDTQHSFFRAASGRNLIRKVIYTDERSDDLLTNPIFLFMVKNQDWSFNVSGE